VNAPASYADWAELLRHFENGEDDAAALAALRAAVVPSGEGVDGRLFKRVVDAFEARVRRIADELQKRLGRARDEVSYVQAITAARRGLGPIADFARAPCWRNEIGTRLCEALDGFVERTQKALERAAGERARIDQGLQLTMVRRNPLTLNAPSAAALPDPPQAAARPSGDPAASGPSPTRRIIF
jgi:hypothetical protein